MSWKGQCGDRLCFPYFMNISRLALSAEIDVPPGHLALLCFDLFFPLFSVWFSSDFDANFIPFLLFAHLLRKCPWTWWP